jgi:hypothetical protein
VFQNVTSLRQGNTGEPLNELMDGGVFFKIFEKRGNRNPRASENPSTIYAIRVALYIVARRPINHGCMVALWAATEKKMGEANKGSAEGWTNPFIVFPRGLMC